jgi:hypothetical protein
MRLKPERMKMIMSLQKIHQLIYLYLILMVILTGCGIPSVHPLYEAEDLILDERLTGTWTHSNTTYAVMSVNELIEHLSGADLDSTYFGNMTEMDEEDIDFFRDFEEQGKGNLYFIQKKGSEDGIYIGGLIKLGNNYYLDLYQLYFESDGTFKYPVHIFMKISIDDSELIMHMFSDEWLKDQIKNRQIRIKHEINDMDEFLLTAPTSELQKFVIKYGDMDQAYRDTNVYKKINNTPEFEFSD